MVPLFQHIISYLTSYLSLNLDETVVSLSAKSTKLPLLSKAGSFSWHASDAFEQYHYIKSYCITTSISLALSICVLIWCFSTNLCSKTDILIQGRFKRASSIHFQALMMEKLTYMYYNKRITICYNSNVQSISWPRRKWIKQHH